MKQLNELPQKVKRKKIPSGLKWISNTKRLAIYLRDDLKCVYCLASYMNAQLTVDHLKPISKGGSNHHHNLVTCCLKCNMSKKDEKYSSYTLRVHGEEGLKRVRNARKRKLNSKVSGELIKKYGTSQRYFNFLLDGCPL